MPLFDKKSKDFDAESATGASMAFKYEPKSYLDFMLSKMANFVYLERF